MNDSRNTGTLLNITVVLDSSLFVLHSSLKDMHLFDVYPYLILISPKVLVVMFGTTTTQSILTFMAAMPLYLLVIVIHIMWRCLLPSCISLGSIATQ